MTAIEAINRIQDARLEWALACHCTCPACDWFYETVRDAVDTVPELDDASEVNPEGGK